MVAALDSMQGVDNLELYVKVALQAGNPVMAKILTESAVLTAGYHKHVAPLKRLAPMARLARAEKDDGTIVLVLPNDHIIWSEMVADVAGSLIEKAKISNGEEPEIWALGDFSALALSKLEGMGWKVHTNVRSQLIPRE
ncbi:MAG: hypothetical protein HKP41_04215 [Desulfobacterales bacterium]|nr:hypothetical protein [Deltaproteobacteria bacterium]NNK93538.1 hypothetical protein [Desulfobacterales bacterium]